MKNPVIDELLVTAWCVVCGCASGVWYDFFKAIRKNGLDSDLLVALEDVLFWVGETILVYLTLYYANNGILRWYEFAFIISGFVVYRWLISNYFLCLWGKILTVFKVIIILMNKLAVKVKKAEVRCLGEFQGENRKKQR